MKKIFTFLSVTLIAASMNAQTAKTTSISTAAVQTSAIAVPAQDDMLSLPESEYNFGKIPQGKPVTHIFAVNNVGKEDLKISNVQASCGCTTPMWEKDKAVAPKASTDITVGYNAAAEGPFNKTITITYNDGKTKVMTIKGEVWKTPSSSAPENKGVNDLN